MNRRATLAVALAASFLAAPLAAEAILIPPSIQVEIDGNIYLAPVWQSGPTEYQVGTEGGPWTVNLPGQFSFSMYAAMDTDPYVSYGISVQDFGAPSTFTFTFTDTLLPAVVGPNTVRATFGGSLLDLAGDGVAIAPFAQPALQVAVLAAGGPAVSMGVDLGSALSYGGPVAPGSVHALASLSTPVLPGPLGSWTSMSVTTSFSLTGGGDIASLTGYAEIIPVPEPSIWLMAGLGLSGVLLGARRLRRTAKR